MHHYNSTQYCKTETVFYIFPFLQTNITSQIWPCGGNQQSTGNNFKGSSVRTAHMCVHLAVLNCGKNTAQNTRYTTYCDKSMVRWKTTFSLAFLLPWQHVRFAHRRTPVCCKTVHNCLKCDVYVFTFWRSWQLWTWFCSRLEYLFNVWLSTTGGYVYLKQFDW